MDWQPLGADELSDLIARAEAEMGPSTRVLWRVMRVHPTKWRLSPWGDAGGGFWVVARIGEHVVWYNDIEGGFNVGRAAEQGAIFDYGCNQDELQHLVGFLHRQIEDAEPLGMFGPTGD